jgi:transcriptional regulator with AAA-type ATPase domain
VEEQLQAQREEQQAALLRLAPHIVGRTRRGVVGSSRYAKALREAVRRASDDSTRQPVLISGEPGLEKDNLAALIHFGSPDRHQLLVQLDGALLRPDGAELFGSASADGEGSLLDTLGSGSLLIDKLDQVPAELQPALLQLARNGRWQAPGAASHERQFTGRVYFTAEASMPSFDRACTLIRVPPLRVRRQDLGEWLRYGVRQRSRKLGWDQPPEVPEAVVKRLQIYDFPNNLRELEMLIYRALQQARRQADGGSDPAGAVLPTALPEDVFWTSPRQQRFRFDIWRWKPRLRELMRAPWLWNGLLFGLVSWLFVLVNLWLWLGPQDRAHNGALNLFWAWWWPLILVSFPLVGRLWCSFCPFMVWGEISQRLAAALGWQPARWPRGNTDDWASPLLAAGFAAILIWEETANLLNTAWLSSCLLLLITAGAVIGSLRFEKRFWCRYLCPVGGMNGLFAKLSILELRAQVGTCSGSCSSYACFKGGAADGEGLATAGCPLGTHPAHLSDNRNCVLCLTCAQACPHRSVQLALRPPAADLQREMEVPRGEAGLLLVLAGDLCLHGWQRLLGWLPLAPASLVAGPLLPRLAFACLALALPSGLFLLARPFFSAPRLRRTLYGLLPLVWALLLARHLPMGMAEAGLVLPVSVAPLAPPWAASLPRWSADPHVIGFCQSAAVLLGFSAAVVVLRRMLQSNRLAWLSSTALALLLALGGRWLVAF